MPFWGNARFKNRLSEIVQDGNAERVQQGAYELSLGREVYVSGERAKEKLDPGSIVTIDPGATALLLTEEVVTIPNGTIGFISVRSRTKGRGLVNISGFHVDPGFSGKLVFTVHNASPESIVLNSGEQYFLLWIADMDPLETGELHPGRQNTIPADSVTQLRSKPTSTVELKKDLDKLHGQRTLIIGVCVAIVLALLALVGEGFPWSRLGEKIGNSLLPAPTQPPTPATTQSPAPATTQPATPGTAKP